MSGGVLSVPRMGCCLINSQTYRLLDVPTGLTLRIATFHPQTLALCFVWFSEQAAVITFTTRTEWFLDMDSVYCEVRTEFKYAVRINFRF
jgi:hypothetical protein